MNLSLSNAKGAPGALWLLYVAVLLFLMGAVFTFRGSVQL